MDIPNERSSHTRPTPRGGGLGFIMAFAVAMALAQRYAPGLLVGTIAPQTWLALVPLALIGVIDDWRNLPSAVRYLVQLGTAWYVVSGYGAFTFPWLDQLGSLAGPLAFVISVICFTALINFLQLYGWPGWPGGWGIGGAAGVSGPVVSATGAVAVGCRPGRVPVLELVSRQNFHGRCWQYHPGGGGGHGPDDPAQ